MIELVIARHQEDLAWTRHVPPTLTVTVYNKGAPLPSPAITLPNRGREAHTYLHHLVHRYDSLAPLTVFTQGKPFDHAPDLHQTLRAIATGALTVSDFKWLGFLVDTDDRRGRRLFVPWSKNPARAELPLDECYEQLFGQPSPAQFRFHGGAQFIVSAACVRRRPLEFYRRALALTVREPLAAHCLERIWDAVFGVTGVSEELMQGRATVYLKKIKAKGIPLP
ncbi:MAG: DUF3431 domain-containing protein [Verrucomicrobiales bacterium]|jgi:hypothetical protein|nr:DUF3431 domain-containing protein [Verrucomicrobiales bacterium]